MSDNDAELEDLIAKNDQKKIIAAEVQMIMFHKGSYFLP